MRRPLRGNPAGLKQAPRADAVDQPRLFGDRNELGRRDGAQFGIVKADQRFKADEFTRLEAIDWLEIETEGVLCQRVSHRALDGDPAAGVLSDGPIEEAVARRTLFLGL